MENSLSLAFGSTAFPAAQGRWILRSKRRRELKKKVALLGIVNPSVGFADSSPAGEPLVRFTSSHVKPALKGEVDASVTSRRRGCIEAALVCANPSVGFADSSPAGEPFGRCPNSYVKPPSQREVAMSVSELTEGVSLTAPPPSFSKTPRPGRKAGCAACRCGGI